MTPSWLTDWAILGLQSHLIPLTKSNLKPIILSFTAAFELRFLQNTESYHHLISILFSIILGGVFDLLSDVRSEGDAGIGELLLWQRLVVAIIDAQVSIQHAETMGCSTRDASECR